eukprot:6475814-Amphidinium_carterae.2
MGDCFLQVEYIVAAHQNCGIPLVQLRRSPPAWAALWTWTVAKCGVYCCKNSGHDSPQPPTICSSGLCSSMSLALRGHTSCKES